MIIIEMSSTSKKADAIKNLTKEQCIAWAKSFHVTNNVKYSKNPLSLSKIKYDAALHNMIKERCLEHGIEFKVAQDTNIKDYLATITDISDLQPWLSNPLYNPLTKKNDIEISLQPTSKYVAIYIHAFDLLKKTNLTDVQILEKLPKNHLIYDFNYIYHLNYNRNIISDHLIDIINAVKPNKNEKFDQLKNRYYNHLCSLLDNEFINMISPAIFAADELCKDKTIENVLTSIDLNILKQYKTKCSDIIEFYKKSNYSKYIDTTYRFQKWNKVNYTIGYKLLEDVIKLLSYDDSVVSNKDNIQVNEMADPLLAIFDKPEFKDINKETLDLPKQNFTDSKYAKIMNDYNTKLESYNKSKREHTGSKTPPPRPTMIVGTTRVMIGVQTTLPKQNYNDSKYKKMKDAYNKNKPIIEAYKELLNKGFLDLTNNTSFLDNDTLINKTREEIYKHHLSDDVDRKKCNSNTDAISQDDFDDDLYPLAKLQLMVKLHTRDDDNEIIRTDCFYAPNIYNLLVSLAKNKKSFKNPMTRKKLTDENINEIMKVVKIIDPTLVVPYYIRETYDKNYKLTYYEVTAYDIVSGRHRNYYKIEVFRDFGGIRFGIIVLCYILADIETNETGSADITSTTFLFLMHKLFNEGKLLKTYMPPYIVDGTRTYLPPIVNNYNSTDNWVFDIRTKEPLTRADQIDRFKELYTAVATLL